MEKANKIICPTCKGNGFIRVPYHLAREEMHAQCSDCDSQGELTMDVGSFSHDLKHHDNTWYNRFDKI